MSRTAKLMALVAVAGAFVFVNFDRSEAANGGGPAAMTFVLEGNYRVYYDCVFTDKMTAKDKEEQVKRIEFHPEYVVLINQTGSGRLVPVYAIKSLRWEQS